jgi:hypothetical protein
VPVKCYICEEFEQRLRPSGVVKLLRADDHRCGDIGLRRRNAADQIDPKVLGREMPDSVEYFGRLSAWLRDKGLAFPIQRPALEMLNAGKPPGAVR